MPSHPHPPSSNGWDDKESVSRTMLYKKVSLIDTRQDDLFNWDPTDKNVLPSYAYSNGSLTAIK